VRVPEAVGKGKAKITLSFPDWKEGQTNKVTPATLEVPVAEAKPGK
jgi:hypothetical protein